MALSKDHPSIETQSSAPSPPWIELPRDLTANILLRLGEIEILDSADKVCTTWRTVCHDPSMWRVIHIKIFDVSYTFDRDYDLSFDDNDSDGDYENGMKCEVICRRAVDLSQRELVELRLQYFGSDDLFHYISERSHQLKQLKLTNKRSLRYSVPMCKISGACLSATVAKFPHLQELHLFEFSHLTAMEIEVVGRSCPNLNSFTLASAFTSYNDCAKAVAETMPGLRKLRLCGSSMTNEGLEAILDGCCCLEFLDIRGCVYVDLGEKIGKRCSLQIKEMIKHGEYTDTSDFDTSSDTDYDEYGDDCGDADCGGSGYGGSDYSYWD